MKKKGKWRAVSRTERGNHVIELYDLSRDPGEKRDLAGDQPELVKKLNDRLSAWLTETAAQMPTAIK